jgi:hypothetical protein
MDEQTDLLGRFYNGFSSALTSLNIAEESSYTQGRRRQWQRDDKGWTEIQCDPLLTVWEKCVPDFGADWYVTFQFD